jgi:bifunctional non-homologous end joining protein LigD
MKKEGKRRQCGHTKEIIHDEGFVVDARDDGEYVMGTAASGAVAPVAPVKPQAAPNGVAYRPLMLAEKLPEDRKISDYDASEWQGEEKYDGERCLVAVRKGTTYAWSRAGGGRQEGLKRDLAPHIREVVERLPDGDYDGEVVVGRGKSSDVRATVNAQAVSFVIFDVLAFKGVDMTAHSYDSRREILEALESKLAKGGSVFVSRAFPPSEAEVQAIWANGGEGVVLKRRDSVYEPYRSIAWLKIKQHDELVATITGFEKGENGPKSTVVFMMANGVESKAKVRNADWHRRIASGEIGVGTQIEVAYQSLLASGKPRHPVAKRVLGEA